MKLLVEGASELRLIPQLIKAQGISWNDAGIGSRVPYIDDRGGVTNILKAGTISAEFKATGLERLGVWIMPDNRHRGAVEEFLLGLVPDDATELVEYARRSVDGARSRGASLRDVDVTKSVVHTWLAWQEEPGPQLHEAVMRRLLDPRHPRSQPFVSWFNTLFELSSPAPSVADASELGAAPRRS